MAESDGTNTALTVGLILGGENMKQIKRRNLVRMSASTTTVAGDISITSKLIMNDNTAGKILVCGQVMEKVAVSGDVALASVGAITVEGHKPV